MDKINSNPTVYATQEDVATVNLDDLTTDEWNQTEIFNLLRNITDPEHPLTLQQLNVVQQNLIHIDPSKNEININFTPTIPHCSMATLIGLCIRVQLLRTVPDRFKVVIKVTEGSHQSELAVNKQLNDKERVAAALENKHLIEVCNQCLSGTIDK